MARDFVEQPVTLSEKTNLMTAWVDTYTDIDDIRPFIINNALLDVKAFAVVKKLMEDALLLDDDRLSSRALLQVINDIFYPNITDIAIDNIDSINNIQHDIGE